MRNVQQGGGGRFLKIIGNREGRNYVKVIAWKTGRI